MALETKPFRNLPQLPNGTSVADNIKLTDCLPFQHTDINEGVNSFNKITMGQMLCEPVATAGAISGGAYTATCSNYPDFSLTYLDKDGNSHYLIGMKVRVIFTTGITYGSVSGGTYPTLNINGSGAIPLLAQGKTMASGACSAGQSLEFTLIPYGNGVAWDADSNVRESTSDYTIYTDGSKSHKLNTQTNVYTTSLSRFAQNISLKGNCVYLIEAYSANLSSTSIRLDYNFNRKNMATITQSFAGAYMGLSRVLFSDRVQNATVTFNFSDTTEKSVTITVTEINAFN